MSFYISKMQSMAAMSLLLAGWAVAATGNREVSKNPLSPSAETQMKLAGKEIIIEYNSPSDSADSC